MAKDLDGESGDNGIDHKREKTQRENQSGNVEKSFHRLFFINKVKAHPRIEEKVSRKNNSSSTFYPTCQRESIVEVSVGQV